MDKVAFVTGASAGIGESTVRALLDAGYRVYAGARRLERMKPLEARGAVLLELDVTRDASIVAAMRAIATGAGRLDILINNAGYGSYGSLEDVPLDEGRRQFEVNVFGLARLIQLAAPVMRQQGSGTIVNITSMGGKIYEPLGSWYHATKFAVEGLSDCLRMELEPFGINVVIVEPGAIKTEWGGIASESMLKYSGDTVYRDQAAIGAKLLSTSGGSDPKVIADTIARALRAKRPKTRYAAGLGAKPILTLRHWLPDRAFDRIMRLVASMAGRN